jgi:hypothetical protein
MSDFSYSEAKRFEFLGAIPEICGWSFTFHSFRKIQRNSKHKSLLKYHNDKNQTIFDIADQVMDHSTAKKLSLKFNEKQ